MRKRAEFLTNDPRAPTMGDGNTYLLWIDADGIMNDGHRFSRRNAMEVESEDIPKAVEALPENACIFTFIKGRYEEKKIDEANQYYLVDSLISLPQLLAGADANDIAQSMSLIQLCFRTNSNIIFKFMEGMRSIALKPKPNEYFLSRASQKQLWPPIRGGHMDPAVKAAGPIN